MPYIDRDALMRELGINDMDCGKCGWGQYGYCKRGADFTDACFAIENAQTVDVVEVVRCRDCVIHDICRYRIGLGENGFCSQGRRKERG